MPAYQTATLIAEVGTNITKLTLVDLVDGVFRLIARAETPSTVAAPEADITVALMRLAAMLETITGRALTRNERLWIPGDQYGNGAGSLALTTSAAGPLTVVIAALAAEHSARAAFYAARGAYTEVRHIFSIDEVATADDVWLSRQVMALAEVRPEVILMAGGHEGSGTAALERLGQVVGLVTRRLPTMPAIVYAGNSTAVPAVRAAVGEEVELQVAGNLRPTAAAYRLEPARSALARLHTERRLPALPGYDKLQAWWTGYTGTVANDQGIMLRFIAERFGRDALALDVGATHTALQIQASEHYSQAVLTHTGIRAGAPNLLDAAGVNAITRWLPFEIAEGELRNRVLNRMLWPHLPPLNLDDLLLDHALIREAIAAALNVVEATRAEMHYDLVIAGGALARAPQPGFAALVLLDTLLAEEHWSHLAIDLFLDRFSLLATSGVLARLNPDAAVCLLEQDALNNGPLATVVVPYGDLADGRPVLQAELTPSRGEVEQVTVAGGQIARLPLARGQRGTLRIRPEAGVYIGDNAAGAEVLSDEAAIAGSALGVIIDARARPLALPAEVEERSRLLLDWLTALDALPPTVPAIATDAIAMDGQPVEQASEQEEPV